MVLKAVPGIGDQRRVLLKALRNQGRDSFQDPGWGVRLNLLRFGGCRLSKTVISLDHVMSKATKTSKWLVLVTC